MGAADSPCVTRTQALPAAISTRRQPSAVAATQPHSSRRAAAGLSALVRVSTT
ncbi:hypothetical protein ACWEPC_41570 [Nonomuraea sp. NPDC004297]